MIEHELYQILDTSDLITDTRQPDAHLVSIQNKLLGIQLCIETLNTNILSQTNSSALHETFAKKEDSDETLLNDLNNFRNRVITKIDYTFENYFGASKSFDLDSEQYKELDSIKNDILNCDNLDDLVILTDEFDNYKLNLEEWVLKDIEAPLINKADPASLELPAKDMLSILDENRFIPEVMRIDIGISFLESSSIRKFELSL